MQFCSFHVHSELVTKRVSLEQFEAYFSAYADTFVGPSKRLRNRQYLREEDAVSFRKALLPSTLLLRTHRSYSDTVPNGVAAHLKRLSFQRVTLSNCKWLRSYVKGRRLLEANLAEPKLELFDSHDLDKIKLRQISCENDLNETLGPEPIAELTKLEPTKTTANLEPIAELTKLEPTKTTANLEPIAELTKLEPTKTTANLEPIAAKAISEPTCFEEAVDALDSTLLMSLPKVNVSPKAFVGVNSSMLTPIRGLSSTCKLGQACDHAQSVDLKSGDILVKRYEILNEIERGGFGIVYRARQLGIDRVVAIKRMRNTSNVELSKRFLLEANIIKNLIHPNTIQLIDAGTDENGHLYIVMEYIHGESLRRVLERGPCMTYQRAANIAIQVLKSMHEAHYQGIIHRDLKPSNILLRDVIGEKDFVKVLDFGVAKVTHSDASKLTQDGKILGSPQYISPELCTGKPAGPYSDLYALGLVFVQMLTGRSLVPNEPMQAIQCHLSEAPHVLPIWLERSVFGPILKKALAKDCRERYQDAKTMIFDLQKALQWLDLYYAQQSQAVSANQAPLSQGNMPLKTPKSAFIRSEKALRLGMFVILSVVNIVLIYILILSLNGKAFEFV